MSNKLPKDEVIVKCTKVHKKRNDGIVALGLKNEFNGTTIDCMLAIASLVVDLENNQPEEEKARFRADFMEYVNKIRCRKVIN